MDVPRESEALKLNPNCCYQACAGCTSIARLRDFQGRYPTDWQNRLIGSERLLVAARQHEGFFAVKTVAAEVNCADCGAFDARDFGHVWLCPDCHARKGASCAGVGIDQDCANASVTPVTGSR
jgi:hypothetical protein